jgi:hypothetical protein
MSFILTFFSLLSLYKYLLKLIRGTILLFVLEHAVHTFFAINLHIKNDIDADSSDHASIYPGRCLNV